MIHVTCQNQDCNRSYRLADAVAGKKVKCAQCGTAFVVPCGESPTMVHVADPVSADSPSSGKTAPPPLPPRGPFDGKAPPAAKAATNVAQGRPPASDVDQARFPWIWVAVTAPLAIAIVCFGIWATRDEGEEQGARNQPKPSEEQARESSASGDATPGKNPTTDAPTNAATDAPNGEDAQPSTLPSAESDERGSSDNKTVAIGTLQGRWKVVSVSGIPPLVAMQGKVGRVDWSDYSDHELTVSGEQFTWRIRPPDTVQAGWVDGANGKVARTWENKSHLVQSYAVSLDPSTNPMSVDLVVLDDNKPTDYVLKGIFELDGEELQLCVADVDVERPTSFSVANDERSVHSYTLVRDKDATLRDEAARVEDTTIRATVLGYFVHIPAGTSDDRDVFLLVQAEEALPGTTSKLLLLSKWQGDKLDFRGKNGFEAPLLLGAMMAQVTGSFEKRSFDGAEHDEFWRFLPFVKSAITISGDLDGENARLATAQGPSPELVAELESDDGDVVLIGSKRFIDLPLLTDATVKRVEDEPTTGQVSKPTDAIALFTRVLEAARIPESAKDDVAKSKSNVEGWQKEIDARKEVDPVLVSFTARFIDSALVERILGPPDKKVENQEQKGLFTVKGELVQGPVYWYGNIGFHFCQTEFDGKKGLFLFLLRHQAMHSQSPAGADN